MARFGLWVTSGQLLVEKVGEVKIPVTIFLFFPLRPTLLLVPSRFLDVSTSSSFPLQKRFRSESSDHQYFSPGWVYRALYRTTWPGLTYWCLLSFLV